MGKIYRLGLCEAHIYLPLARPCGINGRLYDGRVVRVVRIHTCATEGTIDIHPTGNRVVPGGLYFASGRYRLAHNTSKAASRRWSFCRTLFDATVIEQSFS